MSYDSKNATVMQRQLSVQQLVLRASDVSIVSNFASTTPVVNVAEPVVAGSVSAIAIRTGGTVTAPTSIAVSGNTFTPTFGAALLATDVLVVFYEVRG